MSVMPSLFLFSFSNYCCLMFYLSDVILIRKCVKEMSRTWYQTLWFWKFNKNKTRWEM